MGALHEILLGTVSVTALVLSLVLLVLLARYLLAPRGEVNVLVNGERSLRAPAGARLFEALASHGILLPAACGGRGTCGTCRVHVTDAGAPGPSEVALLDPRELAAGTRLACQTVLEHDVEVRVPDALLGVHHVTCRVRSSRGVATFLRELVLELPRDEVFDFRAGAFVQVDCPAYELDYSDLEVEPRFRAAWEALDLWRLRAGTTRPTSRAYSLANRPCERDVLVLNVRLATPPPHLPDVPPGVVSSWLFGLRPGDEVAVVGPFGHFFAEPSEREMVLIGGGAGMAPLRAHVFDQLEGRHTTRKVGFWYGARSASDLFYVDDFERLQREHPNFTWTVALSEPRPEDAWQGPVGFIHEVLRDGYLLHHENPAACEYYLCGPPLMVRATRRLLDGLGVDPADVHCDDFGGTG